LDIEFLNQLGTTPHNDSSKNDFGVGEKEEEMKQLEIGITTAEPSANVNLLHTFLSRTKTPPSNEHQ